MYQSLRSRYLGKAEFLRDDTELFEALAFRDTDDLEAALRLLCRLADQDGTADAAMSLDLVPEVDERQCALLPKLPCSGVQVGAFRSAASAAKVATELENREIRADIVEIVTPSNRVAFRVIAGPACDEPDLQHLTARLKSLGYPTIVRRGRDYEIQGLPRDR